MFIEKLDEKGIKFLVQYIFNADKHETYSYRFIETRVKFSTKEDRHYALAQVEVTNIKNQSKIYNVYMTDESFKVESLDYNVKHSDDLIKQETKYEIPMYQIVYRKGMEKIFGAEYDQFFFDKYVAKTM